MMNTSRVVWFFSGAFLLLFAQGCSQDETPSVAGDGDTDSDTGASDTDGDSDSDSDGDSDGDSDSDSDTDTGTENPCLGENPPEDCQMVPSGPACGDGELNQDWEDCDDGNPLPGDGCTGMCKVEAHYTCPTAGEPCEFLLDCGNGITEPGETCDDGDEDNDNGCNNTCDAQSPDYTCPSEGGPCTLIVFCGDGRVEGTETCDVGSADATG